MSDPDHARAVREEWLAAVAAAKEWDALPVYMPGRVPEGLATRRQLSAAGLSAARLKPAGRLHYCAYNYLCPLYRQSDARPVRLLTDRQRAALAAGRALAGTVLCGKCGQARTAPWSGNRWCDPCLEEEDRRRWAEEVAARKREVEGTVQWAREVLADPSAVILDLETLERHEDQWAYLSTLGRITPQELKRAADRAGKVAVAADVTRLTVPWPRRCSASALAPASGWSRRS